MIYCLAMLFCLVKLFSMLHLKAIVMVEGHMDDGLTFSRAQIEEDKSARVIRKCTSLISRFIKYIYNIYIIHD